MARRTREDALATRSALLDAAEQQFALHGVSRTSLAAIAQAAGLTRGALYWHFKDKADLFNAMLDRVVLPLSGEFESLLSEEHDDGAILAHWWTRLAGALHQIANDAQTQRVLTIAMQKAEHNQELEPVLERHVQMSRTGADCERQVLERTARVHGIDLPAPAITLARGLHAMIQGLVYAWLLDPCFDLPTCAQTAVTNHLRGMGIHLQTEANP